MINEHDCVVLTEDLPAKNLKAGDIGAVVLVQEEGKGYTVEFMNRKLLSDIRGRTEQGDAQSQSELGSAFRPGNLGVAKEAVEAVKGAGVHALGVLAKSGAWMNQEQGESLLVFAGLPLTCGVLRDHSRQWPLD